MELNPKPPFNFHLTVTNMYLMPPAKYSDGIFSRILRLKSGKFVCVSIRANDSVDEPKLFVSAKPKVSKDDEREIREKVSFMFSIEDDLTKFYSIAQKDSILMYAIKDLYGLKIQTSPTLFEGLVIGFCLQWVSFQRGVKMMDCLIKRYGESFNDYYTFPMAIVLAKATLEELKECKLGFRAERIKSIAEKVAEGLNLEKLKAFPDNRLREELMKIKWIGEFTSEALLLWRFKRYNAFPLDVWSRKILQALYPKLKNQSINDIAKFAAKSWGNYRGLAYYYLICARKNLAQKLGIKLKEK